MGEARTLIREPMKRWGLEDMIPVTELLVSELVTNALRYSPGHVTLRLVGRRRWSARSATPPPRCPGSARPGDDENGRGLQVVRQLAQRWGARRTATGKVVRCEQPLPASSALDDVQPLHCDLTGC